MILINSSEVIFYNKSNLGVDVKLERLVIQLRRVPWLMHITLKTVEQFLWKNTETNSKTETQGAVSI